MTSEFIEEHGSGERKTTLVEVSEDMLINLPLYICGFIMVVAILRDWVL